MRAMPSRKLQTGTDNVPEAVLQQRMAGVERLRTHIAGRRFADWVLIALTATELGVLIFLSPSLTMLDWIYVLQHLWVVVIALIRPAPAVVDRSLTSLLAVAASYTYPYAQVILLQWASGLALFPEAGLFLVILAAGLSVASLIAIGRLFGLRPALRGLATKGPYGLVRHPMYLAYVLSDIGYELQESTVGTLLLMLAGWASLLYRMVAEERVLSQDPGWPSYVRSVRYRLLPGVW